MRMSSFSSFWTKKTLIGLTLGQFVSLLVTSTGFSSSELSRRGIDAPTSQSLLNYVLLAVVYGSVMIYRRRNLEMKWWYYLFLGFVDVEANFMVVKAYQYTSLTSVTLLDCWAIPCVLVLTWIFLKTRYGVRQILGVVICIGGVVMVIFSDVHAGDKAGGPNPVKGDLLVIGGAMLYAVSNTSEEFLVKNGDRVELMAMLGVFGAIVSAFQISIFEREELSSIEWSSRAVLPFVGFALAMFLFYSTVPTLLKITGAAMLNLSLLTSDMWAVLIRIVAYHETVDWLYFIAFAAVSIGLVIYSGKTKDVAETGGQVAAEDDTLPRDRDEEAAIGGPRQKQTIDVDGGICSKDKTSASADPAVFVSEDKKKELI